MARYYFHVIDGHVLVDQDGTDCSDMDDVREQAIVTAGAMLKDLARKFPNGGEWQMHVTDEFKLTVLKLRFSLEQPDMRAALHLKQSALGV